MSTPFAVSKLNRRLQRLVGVYTCKNAKLLEITCCGSYKTDVKTGICCSFKTRMMFCVTPRLYSLFYILILLGFSLTVKAATLIFISGCGSANPSAKEGKSGFIYNFVKS